MKGSAGRDKGRPAGTAATVYVVAATAAVVSRLQGWARATGGGWRAAVQGVTHCSVSRAGPDFSLSSPCSSCLGHDGGRREGAPLSSLP